MKYKANNYLSTRGTVWLHRLILFPFILIVLFDTYNILSDLDLGSLSFLIVSITFTYFLSNINSIKLDELKIKIISYKGIKTLDYNEFESVKAVLPNTNFFYIKFKTGEKFIFAFFTSRYFFSIDTKKDEADLTEKILKSNKLP